MTTEKIREVFEDCKNINNNFTFYDVVSEHSTIGKISLQWYFYNFWEFVPKQYLYDLYKDMFRNAERDARSYYAGFFRKDLLNEIK